MNNPYADLIKSAAEKEGIDPVIFERLLRRESANFDPNVISGKRKSSAGALGIAQFMPDTAKELGIDPLKPEEAIPASAKYLAGLQKQFGNIEDGLRGYNWGMGNLQNWIDKHGRNPAKLPKETVDYVSNILGGDGQKMMAGSSGTDEISDEQIVKMFTKKKNSSTAQATPSTPAEISDEDIVRMFAKKKGDGTQKPSPTLTPAQAYKEEMISKVKENLPEGLPPEAYEGAAKMRNLGPEIWQGVKNVAVPIGALYGGKEHLKESMGKLAEENKLMEELDPHHIGRGVGEMGAIGPLFGMAARAAAPAIEGALPTLGKYITGGVESNAIRNTAGQLLQPATWGNFAQRVASKIIPGEIGTQAFVAATQGASEKPYIEQAKAAIIPGALVGPAAEVLTSAARGLWDMVGKQAPKDVKEFFDALQKDNISPDEIKDYMAKNPDSTILDAANALGGGENTLGLAKQITETAAQRGDKNLTLNAFLSKRQEGTPGAITKALDSRVNSDVVSSSAQEPAEYVGESAARNLGTQRGENFYNLREKTAEEARKAATPFYETARKANQDISSPTINKILETDEGKLALRDAVSAMRRKLANPGVSDPELVAQAKLVGSYIEGSGGISKGLKLQTFDEVKRSLDGQIGRALREGDNARAADIIELKNSLLRELDFADATGAYKQGRAIASKGFADENALEVGRNLLKKDAGYYDKVISKMSESEKQNVAQGLQIEIENKFGRIADHADEVKAFLKSPEERARIKSAFNAVDPSGQKYKAFLEDVKNAKSASLLNKLKANPEKILKMKEEDLDNLPFKSAVDKSAFKDQLKQIRNELEVAAKVSTPSGVRLPESKEMSREEKAARLMKAGNLLGQFAFGGPDMRAGVAAGEAARIGINKLIGGSAKPMTAAEAFQAGKKFYDPVEAQMALDVVTQGMNPKGTNPLINRLLMNQAANANRQDSSTRATR